MAKKLNGLFITLEGIEGCGKTTQVKMLEEHLLGQGYPVLFSREPGGTVLGEKLREMLKNPENTGMFPLTELLLFSAARYQHIHQMILPALQEGMIVLSDRFADATLAYQGYGRGIPLDEVRQINAITTWGVKPDLTLLLDIEVWEGMKRAQIRFAEENEMPDRFEREKEDFFQKVREGYLQLQNEEPERIKIIEAAQEERVVHGKILELLQDKLKAYGPPLKINF